MLGSGRTSDVLGAYLQFTQAAFEPGALPTWLPRLVVLVLGSVGVAALVAGWAGGGTRRQRGPFWWRILRPPLSSLQAVEQCWRVMWDLLRGAAQLKEPTPLELSRRFTELVAENIGQPGFREMVLAVHDLDAHRDLVFTLVAQARRRDLLRRSTIEEAEERRAGVFDLSGVAREYLPDVVAGALAVPVASEPSTLRFAPEAFWRGETHRLCDRPASVARVLEELIDLEVEQILLVSAAPGSTVVASSVSIFSRPRPPRFVTRRAWRRVGPPSASFRSGPRTIPSAPSISRAGSTIDPIGVCRSTS
jgi:hypothetical protein